MFVNLRIIIPIVLIFLLSFSYYYNCKITQKSNVKKLVNKLMIISLRIHLDDTNNYYNNYTTISCMYSKTKKLKIKYGTKI